MGRLRRFVDLQLETLEDRRLLAGNIISGYVFDDLNGNGLRDAGELAIANSTLELRNASGVLVGTTTSDANGYYAFAVDNTAGNAQQSLVKTVSFADGTVNTIRSQTLPQFDPALGALQSIEIRVDGKIISDIKIENLDDEASPVAASVSGTVLLNGPGINLNVSILGNATVSQSVSAYDGNTDYAGSSGVSLGSRTATGSNTLTLTGTATNAFIGSGTVNLSFLAQATTQASGGGNLIAHITNQGGGQVTVTYKYLKNADLKAGNYTIKQKSQPTGFLDGRDSQNGVLVANSFNTDVLNVVLASVNSVNNNFGEYRPASVNGFVYQDNNNNGIKDAAEQVFAAMQIKLTGKDDRGTNVNLTTTTNVSGFYQFANLRPGQYSVTQVTQPKGFSPGLLTVGSVGGSKTNRTFNGINAAVGQLASNYNFGQLSIMQPSASGPYSGKSQLVISPNSPVPPNGVVVTNPYSGKSGLVIGPSTPSPTPPAGVVVTNPYSGKSQLVISPSTPPNGIVITNPYSGKSGLIIK